MRLRKFLTVIIFLIAFPFLAALADANNAKEAETLFMAKKAFEDGFYEVSLGLLERFLKNYPDSEKTASVNLLIAECYFHQNKFLDALTKFESLLSSPQSKGLKDEIYYGIAEVHFKGGNFDKAETFYKNIIKEFSNSSYLPAAYYSLGYCLFQQQKYKEALDYFQALENKYPKELQVPDAVFKSIECLYNLKDYSSLRDKINSSFKLFAKDPLQSAYLNFYLGEACYYLGNFKEAAGFYSKAQTDNRDEKMLALCKLNLAWSYIKLKRHKDAEDIFLNIKQSDLEKRSQEAYMLGLAILMMDTNRVNQASGIYSRLIDTSTDPLILAQAYIGKADALYNLADYKGAISAYKLALQKISPDELPAGIIGNLHYNFSWALFKDGRFKEAIREFELVVSQADGDVALKASTLCQIGDSYQELGEFDKARDAYNLVCKDYPLTAYSDYAQYQIGETLIKSSDYRGAVDNLTNFIKSASSSKYAGQAAYRIALSYFKRQDYKESKELLLEFQDEFKDDSLKMKARYLLGDSFYNLGDYQAALQVYKEIVKSGNEDTELMQKAEYNVADCYYQLKEDKEALNRFKALRSKYPDASFAPEVIWWLGSYYYQHNDPNMARRYFLSITKDFPKSALTADSYYTLGLILADENRLEDALGSFTKARVTDKADLKAKIAMAMAVVYTRLEKPESAIPLYKDALLAYPGFSGQIYPQLADLYLKALDYNNAINYYRKSMDSASAGDLPGLHLKMAEAYEAQSKLDAAVDEYLKAAELSGEDKGMVVKSLLRIGQIYEDKEDYKESIKYYKKIVSMEIKESSYAQERINQIKKRPQR